MAPFAEQHFSSICMYSEHFTSVLSFTVQHKPRRQPWNRYYSLPSYMKEESRSRCESRVSLAPGRVFSVMTLALPLREWYVYFYVIVSVLLDPNV